MVAVRLPFLSICFMELNILTRECAKAKETPKSRMMRMLEMRRKMMEVAPCLEYLRWTHGGWPWCEISLCVDVNHVRFRNILFGIPWNSLK